MIKARVADDDEGRRCRCASLACIRPNPTRGHVCAHMDAVAGFDSRALSSAACSVARFGLAHGDRDPRIWSAKLDHPSTAAAGGGCVVEPRFQWEKETAATEGRRSRADRGGMAGGVGLHVLRMASCLWASTVPRKIDHYRTVGYTHQNPPQLWSLPAWHGSLAYFGRLEQLLAVTHCAPSCPLRHARLRTAVRLGFRNVQVPRLVLVLGAGAAK